MNGEWHDPEVELVSIYCDQKKAGEAHPSLKEEEGVLLGDLAHLREQVGGKLRTFYTPLLEKKCPRTTAKPVCGETL